jgi:HEAT repeat protein
MKTHLTSLEKAIRHEDPEVRWIGVTELERMGGDEATDLLLEALSDTTYDSIRWRAAIALGERRERRAVESLIGALGDPNHHVRAEVVGALGRIGDPRAINPLIGLLNDPYRSIRLRAIRALEQIGEPAGAALTRALTERGLTPREAIREAIREIEEAERRRSPDR